MSENFPVIYLKFRKKRPNLRVFRQKDANEIANSGDPDKTAPLGAVWSGSALFAQTYLSENFWIITVYQFKMQEEKPHRGNTIGTTCAVDRDSHIHAKTCCRPSPVLPVLSTESVINHTCKNLLSTKSSTTCAVDIVSHVPYMQKPAVDQVQYYLCCRQSQS